MRYASRVRRQGRSRWFLRYQARRWLRIGPFIAWRRLESPLECTSIPAASYRALSFRLTGHGSCPILNRVVEYNAPSLDSVFAAVADPTRRAILRQLGKHPARITDIAKKFPVSLNAVSKHLKVLERAGLIEREVEGREHICKLNAEPLDSAALWLAQTRAFWERRLDAFEKHVLENRKRRK